LQPNQASIGNGVRLESYFRSNDRFVLNVVLVVQVVIYQAMYAVKKYSLHPVSN